MICKIVQKHQEQNNGKTDLTWLKLHVKHCEDCQHIMAATDQMISDSLSSLDPDLDGDEDVEDADTQYSNNQ